MSEETPLRPSVFTIGHSTHPIGEFVALLRESGIDLLVDVRSFPGSRHAPQFNSETLSRSLAEAGITYRHMRALGGRRSRRKDDPPSPNGLWKNAAFRDYADYAMSGEFRTALAELVALSRRQCCAVMCAEAVWWRCHRRIIADYLLAAGQAVGHIMAPHTVEPARLTEGARRLPEGGVVYPAPAAAQGTLSL